MRRRILCVLLADHVPLRLTYCHVRCKAVRDADALGIRVGTYQTYRRGCVGGSESLPAIVLSMSCMYVTASATCPPSDAPAGEAVSKWCVDQALSKHLGVRYGRTGSEIEVFFKCKGVHHKARAVV